MNDFGVSFQPYSANQNSERELRQASPDVQEAIKVISLRLPRVLGANAIAPAALLNSQGAGGNPRVDSVVNTILQRMFPNAAPQADQAAPAPMMPPQIGPSDDKSSPRPPSPLVRFDPRDTPKEITPRSRTPRVIPGDYEEPKTPGGPSIPSSLPPWQPDGADWMIPDISWPAL